MYNSDPEAGNIGQEEIRWPEWTVEPQQVQKLSRAHDDDDDDDDLSPPPRLLRALKTTISTQTPQRHLPYYYWLRSTSKGYHSVSTVIIRLSYNGVRI